MSEWIDFTHDEPIGEERDDLRIGALSSTILNMNIDTRKIGGSIKPQDYSVGWNESRNQIFGLVPVSMQGNNIISNEGKDINDPEVWKATKASLLSGLKKVNIEP